MSEEQRASNFWFGFSLGVSASAAAIYFLGTKRGRENLKKLIELTEDLEGTVEEVIDSLGVEHAQQFREIILEKARTKARTEPQAEAKKTSKRFEVQHGRIIE
jgi:predicted transcriptional regulator